MLIDILSVYYPNGVFCLLDTNFVKDASSTKNNTQLKGEALNYPIEGKI
jgi:hypothetical protein